MYYGYYMMPDGTYCLAPPPPGIDATSYYNNTPGGVIAPQASAAAGTHPGTAAATAEVAVMARGSAMPPPHVTTPVAPTVVPETRCEEIYL